MSLDRYCGKFSLDKGELKWHVICRTSTEIQIELITFVTLLSHKYNYTNTQIHKYTNTQIQIYSNTNILKYKYTQIQTYSNTKCSISRNLLHFHWDTAQRFTTMLLVPLHLFFAVSHKSDFFYKLQCTELVIFLFWNRMLDPKWLMIGLRSGEPDDYPLRKLFPGISHLIWKVSAPKYFGHCWTGGLSYTGMSSHSLTQQAALSPLPQWILTFTKYFWSFSSRYFGRQKLSLILDIHITTFDPFETDIFSPCLFTSLPLIFEVADSNRSQVEWKSEHPGVGNRCASQIM